MKALRKCACVAVQLVVTTALLFQQCPVQAIALGLEQGSDYVEIPVSEVDTDAENDSSYAPSNDGNSNEAAPSAAEKDEDEATSSSLDEGSGGACGPVAQCAEDGERYLVSMDGSLEAGDEIAPWTKCGLCEWMIDSSGTLTIRARNSLASAELDNFSKAPWREYSDLITAVLVEKGVIATGNATSRMFYGLSNVASADLSGLDTSKATDMSYMFYGFGKGLTLDLTSFDTGNVTTMRGMFQGSGVVGVDVSSFDTSRVTDMERMFYESRAIWSLDLTSFYVPELLSMKEMFFGCGQLESVKFRNLNARSLKSLESTFRYCKKLKSITLGSLGQTRVWCLKDTFKDCDSLRYVDLRGFSSPVLETIEYICCGDKMLTTFLMSGSFPSELKSSYHAFGGCGSLETLDISGLTFSSKNYTDNAYMFHGVNSLKRISVGNCFRVYKSQSDETFCAPGNSGLFTGKWVNIGNGHSYRALDEIKGDGGTYIWQKELTSATVSVDTSSVVYDGSEHKKIVVSDLIEGEDYTCEYDSNVNAGEARLEVIGEGACVGQSVSFSFAIEKAVPVYDVPASIGCAYGEALEDINLPIGFSWEGNAKRRILEVGDISSFTVKYTPADSANYKSVRGIPVTLKSEKKLKSSLFSVELSSPYKYTGSEIRPRISSPVLTENTDYQVYYENNIDVGNARVVVTGCGPYSGQSIDYSFAIEPSLPSYELPTGLKAAYGQKLSDVKLPEGFSWEDPSLSVGNPGENTFKCKYAAPDDNHTGVEGIEVKVRVTRPVEASMFSVDAKGLAYTGKAHEPVVSSEVVPEDSFSVSYRDNVAAGKAVAVVKGSGFYTGTCEVPFTIAKAKPSYKAPAGMTAICGQKLSDVKLPEGFSWEDPSLSVGDPGENTFKCKYAAPDDNHTGADGIEVRVRVTRPIEASMFSVDAEGLAYTGKAHEPAVSSKVVPEDSFSVSYRDNVAAGRAVAVVKGSGFYTGTCEVPFTIAKAKPSYKVPAGITAIYGQKLSDVKLPEGFSWEDSDTCVDWYGSKAMKAVFAPSDTENYEVVKDIAIPVFVGRDVISVPSIDDLVYTGSIQVPQFDIDGVRVVSNAGGIDVGEYSVELALDDPKLDCWEDGSAGNKTIEYKIVPADINSADIAPISPCLLKDGKAEPAVSVAFGGRELSVDYDFTVSYFDNEKVGTASVSIEGKGNFAGEKTVFFQIAKGDLGDCLVTTKRNVFLYGGSAVEPRIFVSSGDAVLREGVDYKLAYSANNAVGTGHATISGIGDFIGSQKVDFAIVDAIDLSTYCTAHAYDAFYTGEEVCPRVDVRLNTESYDEAYGNGGASRSEDAPVEGQDYTVSYEDNVEPGMATAVVRGRGRYVGEVRVQFHILRNSDFDLSDCSVRLDPPFGVDRYSYALKDGEYSFLYTGSAVEPDVCASLYGESGVYVELRNGVDYEVSYSSNTEPGSATAVVRGINGLAGSQSLGFNVVRKLSVADLLLTKYDFEQSVYQLKPGFALTPKLKTSPSFVEGADYALSYSSCDKVGSGLVTVTGIGRYTGSVVVEVPIVESLDRPLLSDCSFDKIEDQVYTGSEIYPRVVLRSTSGGEVDQTRECGLRYSNNVNVGKATVAASESASSSSYIGEVSTGFNILPADIDDAYFVSIGDAAYTGNEIEPDVLIRFNGKTLVKGTDYDLTYSDNVKVGTAHVVVAGKGNFSGTREMTFNIVRPVISFDQDMVEGKTVSTSWTKKVNVTSYRMVLNRGGMVRIRTSFLRIDSVLCSIQNESGDIIQSWAPSDGGDYGFFALPAGTYYFQYIGSPMSYGGSVYASYSMTPFGEPADTIYEVEDNNGTADGHTIDGDATPIEIGRCFAGSNYYAIAGGYGDLDYFKFTVTKRGHYSMSLFTNARLMFALTDAQGNTLDNRDTGSGIVAQSYSDSLTGLDFGTLEPGTYYVLVLSKDADAIGAAYFGCVFDSSDPAPTNKGVGRVSGSTRYDTMGSLTERGNWAKGGSVVLASGANYPDALAASSLAGGFNGPILLTDPNGLSTSAWEQLESLCPSRVFIVGGNAAVSPDVERQVRELLGSGCAVFRVAGQTRYETSLVAAEINPKSSDTVIVATGGNYADALSVSPYAFASGSPVVLCDKSSGLTAGAIDTIHSKAYSKAVIVGGTAAVPASVERQLRSAGVKNITRLSGATRYETSTKIADFELKSGLGFTMDGVMLATGTNFPDALSAGPLAGRSHSPLLLVDPGASYVSSYLSRFKGTVRSATVVGGAAAVPERDRLSIAQVLGI